MPLPYVGRLAPSPTGYLHAGHGQTFWLAATRAHRANGRLLLRNDDLDRDRGRPEYVTAMREDLAWLGLSWEEPMITQSERLPHYRTALAQLHAAGLIFPCERSRRELREAVSAPHDDEDEPIYPRKFRPLPGTPPPPLPPSEQPIKTNWRFRVPDGLLLTFEDSIAGPQNAVTGVDFGDFLVWRKDDLPSYQLACAVDDAGLGITEVVRGADLIRSTFRQLLLFSALGVPPPTYAHAPLVLDDQGNRLAKRHDALSLRSLRERGTSAETLRRSFSV